MLLVLSAGSMGGYVLLKLNEHAQDPAILYRIGEIQSSMRDATNLALLLAGKQGVDERAQAEHELSAIEADVAHKLDEMKAGQVTNALSADRPMHITLDADELGALTVFENKWTAFLAASHNLVNVPINASAVLPQVQFLIAQQVQAIDELLQFVLRHHDREMREIRDSVSGLMVFVFMISALVFLWLFVRLFRPLGFLTRQLGEVKRGHLDVQLALSRQDEIGQLTGVLQQSLQRLHAMNQLVAAVEETRNRGEILPTIVRHLQPVVPMQWAGLLRLSSGQKDWIIEDEFICGMKTGIAKEQIYALDDEQEAMARRLMSPQICTPSTSVAFLGAKLSGQLLQAGVKSLLLLPMSQGLSSPSSVILLLGNDAPDTYREGDADLMHSFSAILQAAFLRTDQLEAMMLVAVSGLARLAESRDPETGDHLLRMGRYGAIIAEELNRGGPYQGMLSPWLASALIWLAPLHDIGKVGIEDAILLKPGRLNDEERRQMEQHAVIGGEVLRYCHEQVAPYGIDIFTAAADIADGHHEKFDGSGYPQGLTGTTIPLTARIVAVADVFDALTSKRPYKDAWPVEEALGWMRKQTGSHFDPVIMDAFAHAMPAIMDVYEKYRHV